MYSHRVNSPKNLAKYSGNTSSIIFSCIRASANTGPACIRAKIDSPRICPACIGFVPGGIFRDPLKRPFQIRTNLTFPRLFLPCKVIFALQRQKAKTKPKRLLSGYVQRKAEGKK